VIGREHVTKSILNIIFRGFLLISILLTYGGGSSLLQGVAWISMLPKQISLSGSLEKGIEHTFNGENPCSLCGLAEDLRNRDKHTPTPDPEKGSNKMEMKEKITSLSFPPKPTSPRRTIVLIPQDRMMLLFSTLVDVELPPPDFT